MAERPASETGEIHFAREMGITPAEFFRILPAALAGRPFRIHGSAVHVGEGDSRVLIRLSPQDNRIIGALNLPRTQVSFTFTGYTQEAVDTLMAYFNARFQRGGG